MAGGASVDAAQGVGVKLKRQGWHITPGQLLAAGYEIDEPFTSRVEVTAVFYRDRDQGDEDNFEKALGDTLQRAGVVENDRLIHWTGETRLEVDRARPRVEVTIAWHVTDG